MKKILLFLLISLVICQNLRKLITIQDVYNELLEKHNSIRAKHKSPALTYSEAIAKIAQATSERYLELGKIEQKNEYYNGELLGENNYVCGGFTCFPPDIDTIMGYWYYREETFFDYAKGKTKQNYSMYVGHFTQVVWRSTKYIGCGFARGKWNKYKDAYYLNCKYYPAGNIKGSEVFNVLKPQS